MAEYIKRQDAIDAILRRGSTGNYDLNNGLIMAMNAVHSVPTAGVAPAVHGKWEKYRESYCSWSCSVCKEIVVAMPERMGEPMYAYCPNCGARMDEVTDDGEVR